MKNFLYSSKYIFMFVLISVVTAYTQTPNYKWSVKGGGTGKDYGNALTVDANGNIFVTGEFTATADFGNGVSLVSAGNVDYFMVKYDSNHVAQWGKKGGGTLTDRGYGVALDAFGNILVTGHFFGVATFDTASLTSGGNLDVFTLKYNPAGTLQWIKQGTSVSQVSSRALAIDTAGNVIVAAYFGTTAAPTVTFGSFILTSHGQRDICVVKYDPSGNELWAVSGGGSNTGEEPKDVAVDLAGNVYVTGVFRDTAFFGTQTIIGNGGYEMFIAKYTKDGELSWVKSAGGPKDDEGSGIALDNQGYFYVGGKFDSIATFQTTNLVSAGKNDAYIAKYDTSGNLIWIKHGGGIEDDYCNDIAVDRFGDVYGIGQYKVTATFDTSTFVAAGADDILMIKYDDVGNLLWTQHAGGTDIDRGLSVAVDNGGNFYGTGYFRLTANFGSTPLTSTGIEDVFISRLGEFTVPVELVSFNGVAKENSIVLSWQTASETNNRGFEIQRSGDGVVFESIGFVNGNGSTTIPVNYLFADNSPLTTVNYYRLKQIDFDGSNSLSTTIKIEIGLPSRFFVYDNYPNPFNPTTNIQFDLPVDSKIIFTMYNTLGEIVKVIGEKEYTAGNHTLLVDASGLASGVYYYSVKALDNKGNTNIKTSKMVLLR